MEMSSPTLTDATEEAFPPLFTPAEGTVGYRNVAFSFNCPDDRVQNCNTYSCNHNRLEVMYLRMLLRSRLHFICVYSTVTPLKVVTFKMSRSSPSFFLAK